MLNCVRVINFLSQFQMPPLPSPMLFFFPSCYSILYLHLVLFPISNVNLHMLRWHLNIVSVTCFFVLLFRTLRNSTFTRIPFFSIVFLCRFFRWKCHQILAILCDFGSYNYFICGMRNMHSRHPIWVNKAFEAKKKSDKNTSTSFVWKKNNVFFLYLSLDPMLLIHFVFCELSLC